MRPEDIPLDLNHLPDELSISRDGKQILDDGCSSGGSSRKKKSGGKEECGKVYECRFCSLKFCKSQALGGHMNRHRQERETETLNQARQLVFRNDHTIAAQPPPPPPPPHLGCCQPIAAAAGNSNNLVDVRFPRYLSASSSPHISQAYNNLYASPSSRDYYVGHVLHNHHAGAYVADSTNYTCIGAPLPPNPNPNPKEPQDSSLTWGTPYSSLPPPINRFPDAF